MKEKKELKQLSEEELKQVTGGVILGGQDGQQNPSPCEQHGTPQGTGKTHIATVFVCTATLD